MDETIMKLRILARAEVTLARVHGRVLARRLLLTALAVGSILLTIVMVNLGAFELLAVEYGNGAAAFLVASANAVLAVLLVVFANRTRPGPEEQMIQEIRDLALAELSADAEAVREGLNEVTSDLERIRTGIGAITGGAAAGLGSLTPVIGFLVDALKRRNA